jgi:galactokinase
LFFDVYEMRTELTPLPPAAEWIVIDSGKPHDHSAGDYNTRRGECEAACAALGIRTLRELTVGDLPKLAALPEPLGRRAKHVVAENQRVLDARAALRDFDLSAFGKLMVESHVSQRDDYRVSVPEIDLLVELALAEPAVFGARLTGGGFGGSIVALTTTGQGRNIGERLVVEYGRRTGLTARVLTPR